MYEFWVAILICLCKIISQMLNEHTRENKYSPYFQTTPSSGRVYRESFLHSHECDFDNYVDILNIGQRNNKIIHEEGEVELRLRHRTDKQMRHQLAPERSTQAPFLNDQQKRTKDSCCRREAHIRKVKLTNYEIETREKEHLGSEILIIHHRRQEIFSIKKNVWR